MRISSYSLVWLGLAFVALISNSPNTQADVVYVWSNDGTIQKFATNGVGTLVTNGFDNSYGPVGLACDNVGNLYAGLPDESEIWRFSPDGNSASVGNIDSVSGLTFDHAGNLYVTLPDYDEVDEIDYAVGYEYILDGPYTQSHLNYPLCLAFDAAGNFYVTDTGTIEKFSSNFADLGAFATNLNQPWGLAFDSGNNLYVANSGTNGILNNTIVKFNPGGVRSTFATASNGLKSPQGLAFDSAGNLYVANAGNGTIEKFTPDGIGSTFASGLNSPSSIAIFPGLRMWSATSITLNNPAIQPGGAAQFDFNDNPGLAFKVLGTTNASLALTNWEALGEATEISSGHYQFTDTNATNYSLRFYRIMSE